MPFHDAISPLRHFISTLLPLIIFDYFYFHIISIIAIIVADAMMISATPLMPLFRHFIDADCHFDISLFFIIAMPLLRHILLFIIMPRWCHIFIAIIFDAAIISPLFHYFLRRHYAIFTIRFLDFAIDIYFILPLLIAAIIIDISLMPRCWCHAIDYCHYAIIDIRCFHYYFHFHWILFLLLFHTNFSFLYFILRVFMAIDFHFISIFSHFQLSLFSPLFRYFIVFFCHYCHWLLITPHYWLLLLPMFRHWLRFRHFFSILPLFSIHYLFQLSIIIDWLIPHYSHISPYFIAAIDIILHGYWLAPLLTHFCHYFAIGHFRLLAHFFRFITLMPLLSPLFRPFHYYYWYAFAITLLHFAMPLLLLRCFHYYFVIMLLIIIIEDFAIITTLTLFHLLIFAFFLSILFHCLLHYCFIDFHCCHFRHYFIIAAISIGFRHFIIFACHYYCH